MSERPTITEAATRLMNSRGVTKNHRVQVLTYVRHFVAFVGDDSLDAFTDDNFNLWLTELLENSDKGAKTVKGYRGSVLSIWRWCWEDGLIEDPPRRIKKIRVPRRPPTAWTREEVLRLLAACDELRKRGDWARCYIHVVWSTALRTGDVFEIDLRNVDPEEKVVYLSQQKTGDPLCVRLSDDAYQELVRQGGRLSPLGRRALAQLFERLVLIADVRPGTARWLRRSAASYVCREYGYGAAEMLLGHRTPEMCRKHYCDPAIVRTVPKSPPSLCSPDAEEGGAA